MEPTKESIRTLIYKLNSGSYMFREDFRTVKQFALELGVQEIGTWVKKELGNESYTSDDIPSYRKVRAGIWKKMRDEAYEESSIFLLKESPEIARQTSSILSNGCIHISEGVAFVALRYYKYFGKKANIGITNEEKPHKNYMTVFKALEANDLRLREDYIIAGYYQDVRLMLNNVRDQAVDHLTTLLRIAPNSPSVLHAVSQPKANEKAIDKSVQNAPVFNIGTVQGDFLSQASLGDGNTLNAQQRTNQLHAIEAFLQGLKDKGVPEEDVTYIAEVVKSEEPKESKLSKALKWVGDLAMKTMANTAMKALWDSIPTIREDVVRLLS